MMYSDPIDDYAELMTVEEFKICVGYGAYIDDNGFGFPVKNNLMCGQGECRIYPSGIDIDFIPEDATHIAWYNR